MNSIMSIIGLFIFLVLTDFISSLNKSLLNELIKTKILIDGKNSVYDTLAAILWSKKVYILTGIIYSFTLIMIALDVLLGITQDLNVLIGALAQIVLAIVLAELIWVVFAPIYIILILPLQAELTKDHNSRLKQKFNLGIHLNLDVFASDNSMGLSPISSYLLKVSLLITLYGTSLLYWTQYPVLIISLMLLAGIISAPLIYFILPTIGLNKVMRIAKRSALDNLSYRLREAYRTFTNSESELNRQEKQDLQNILLLIDIIEKKREWPFSAKGLRNLLSSFIIPIMIFLFNNADSILAFIQGG